MSETQEKYKAGKEPPALLPCPWCGKQPHHWTHGLLDELHVIRCMDPACPALYVSIAGASREEAARRWNTRATPPAAWRTAGLASDARRAGRGCPTRGADCKACRLAPCPLDLRTCQTCAHWSSPAGTAGRCHWHPFETIFRDSCDHWAQWDGQTFTDPPEGAASSAPPQQGGENA